jgi:hypothetical protein
MPNLSAARIDFCMIPHDSHREQGQFHIWIRRGAYLALFLGLWIALLKFPDYVFGTGPDESYEQSLGFFFQNRMQAGVDYIFTYGPLGYFYAKAYHPDLFWYKYAWEAIIKCLLALVIVTVLARQPGALAKTLFLLVFPLYLIAHPKGIEDFFFPYLILALSLLLITQQIPRFLEGPILFVLAALALVKFTFCILAVVYLVILVMYRLSQKSYLAALGPLFFFGISFLGIWIAAGQSPANISSYIYGSFELTRGHTEAMSLPGDGWQVARALVIVALILAHLPTLTLRALPKARLVALGSMFSVGLFLQWKYGFIRPDLHVVAFLAYASSIPFLLLIAFPTVISRERARVLMTVGCVVLSVPPMMVPKGQTIDNYTRAQEFCSHWMANLDQLIFPERLKASLDVRRKTEFLWTISTLPLTHAKLDEAEKSGTASLDFLHSRQGWVFMHGFHWRPRPVFQSYVTYTRFLQDVNAAFFRSAQSPEFVIICWQPIDERLPTLEDSQALFEILKRYQPILFEKNFLLLKRSDHQGEDPTPDDAVLREQTTEFDQTVHLDDLSGSYHMISFRFKQTFWGRLRSLLFKPPPLHMQVTTSDSKTVSYRFIPSMAEQEFLVDPLVRSGQDLLLLYADAAPSRVKSFSISVSETGPASYEKEMRVRIKSRSKLVGQKLGLQTIKELLPPQDPD